MLNRYVMVIDAGTSAARCHLFNGSANIIGSSTVEWRYVVGKNEPPFARSFNSTVLWETFRDLIVDRLTDAQIQEFEKAGFIIVRSLFSADEIDLPVVNPLRDPLSEDETDTPPDLVVETTAKSRFRICGSTPGPVS